MSSVKNNNTNKITLLERRVKYGDNGGVNIQQGLTFESNNVVIAKNGIPYKDAFLSDQAVYIGTDISTTEGYCTYVHGKCLGGGYFNTLMGYDSTMPYGINNTVVYGPKISVVGNGSVCIGSGSRSSLAGTTIGHQAGVDLSSGSLYNTIIGRLAGRGITNGGNNIAIGFNTHFPSDVSNCLVINNNNQSTRPIGGIYGTNLGLNTFSLGLNNNTPASPLDISGNFVRLRNPTTPTSSADTIGNVGDIAWDVNYVYVKTAVGGWKRSGLTAF
jgi:hypothetical protein